MKTRIFFIKFLHINIMYTRKRHKMGCTTVVAVVVVTVVEVVVVVVVLAVPKCLVNKQ